MFVRDVKANDVAYLCVLPTITTMHIVMIVEGIVYGHRLEYIANKGIWSTFVTRQDRYGLRMQLWLLTCT